MINFSKLPVPGTEVTHHKGAKYRVKEYANLRTKNPEEFPVTVVYQNLRDGSVWSRPVEEFRDKFTWSAKNEAANISGYA